MSTPDLEGLPAEILARICEYVHVPRRTDLSSLSLVDKFCHAVAIPNLFHVLHLKLRVWPIQRGTHTYRRGRGYRTLSPSQRKHPLRPDLAQMVRDISQWQDILSRQDAHRYVRRLELRDAFVGSYTQEIDSWPPQQTFHWPSHTDLLDSEDEFALSRTLSPGTSLDLMAMGDPRGKHEPAWPYLAKLIEQLPVLRDFAYDCVTPLPTIVWGSLDRLDSQCRLHLRTFWFDNYLRDGHLSKEDVEMLLSPRLRSLTIRCSGSIRCQAYPHEPLPMMDRSYDVMVALLRELGPTLENFAMVTDKGQSYDRGTLFWDEDRAWPSRWTAEHTRESVTRASLLGGAGDVPNPLPLKLRVAELGGLGSLPLALVQQFAARIDTYNLRVLKLRVYDNHLSLSWLAANARFDNLTSLVLGLEDPDNHAADCGRESLVVQFLTILPPLRALRFVNDVTDHIFGKTLEHHGSSLKRLWFAPPGRYTQTFFDGDRIKALGCCCSVLEDLALSIARSRGDKAEAELYTLLGRLPRLRILSLTLDCEDTELHELESSWDPPSPSASYDEFDRQWIFDELMMGQYRWGYNGHIRVAMINAAVDETLARDIFHVIDVAKSHTVGAVPLERLELRPMRGVYKSEYADVMGHIRKWWLLERSEHESRRDEIQATPLKYPGDVLDEEAGLPVVLDANTEKIFRKIWPAESKEGSDWRQDWKSLPLDMSDIG